MFNLDPDPNQITRSDLIDETPKEKRQRLMAKNWGLCIYCDDTGTTLDHIIPRKSGLPFVNQEWNLYPCCKRCNGSKADQPWRFFFRKHRFYDPKREKLISSILKEHLGKYGANKYLV